MAGLSAAAVLLISLVALVSTVGYVLVVQTQRERTLAQVDSLRHAEITQVPYLLEDLAPVRAQIAPRLKDLIEQPNLTENEHLRLSLALLPVDDNQVAYLSKRLLAAAPDQVAIIVAGLAKHKAEVVKRFWSVLDDENRDADERLRAAALWRRMPPMIPAGIKWAETWRANWLPRTRSCLENGLMPYAPCRDS